MNSFYILKNKIKSYLNTDIIDKKQYNIFLFWKGRVALYAILKALNIKEGDEVILPAFTCVVVPNPIIYLGAKPVYVDIDPKTFTLNPAEIEKRITKRTKVIIAQNTFGLSPDFDQIKEIANKYNLFLIEDAAHGFGSLYKVKKSGTITDYAFFSTQWNKPFSTGLGGIAVTKDPKIAKELEQIEKEAVKPSKKEEIILKILLQARKKIVSSSTYWLLLKLYRFLSEKNLILGSSQGFELEKPIMPKNFLKRFTEIQVKEALFYFEKVNGIYRIDLIINKRRKIAGFYKKILEDLDIEPAYEPSYAKHSYLKYPLLVKDRYKFFSLAMQWKIPLGDWFISPIHPITKNFKLWFYNYGENPIGEFASRHIVNLPTDIEEDELNKIEEFLKKNRDFLIGSQVPRNFRELE